MRFFGVGHCFRNGPRGHLANKVEGCTLLKRLVPERPRPALLGCKVSQPSKSWLSESQLTSPIILRNTLVATAVLAEVFRRLSCIEASDGALTEDHIEGARTCLSAAQPCEGADLPDIDHFAEAAVGRSGMHGGDRSSRGVNHCLRVVLTFLRQKKVDMLVGIPKNDDTFGLRSSESHHWEIGKLRDNNNPDIKDSRYCFDLYRRSISSVLGNGPEVVIKGGQA